MAKNDQNFPIGFLKLLEPQGIQVQKMFDNRKDKIKSIKNEQN
jgi:hypothetical protein